MTRRGWGLGSIYRRSSDGRWIGLITDAAGRRRYVTSADREVVERRVVAEHATPDPVARFWAHVEWSEGCWNWTGYTNPQGYGITRGEQSRQAHRIAYELAVGPIPEGMVLDHLCRNRMCVNPAHLEPVAQRENVLRGRGGGVRRVTTTDTSAAT